MIRVCGGTGRLRKRHGLLGSRCSRRNAWRMRGWRHGRAARRPCATLIPLDDGGGHVADQSRVFAEGFVHAAPPGVSGNAQHGGESPVHAGGGDFFGGRAADCLHCGGVPAGRHAQLRGEDGGSRPEGVSVDAVVADEQRDAEACFGVHGFDGARQVRRAGVQNRADVFGDDQIIEVAVAGIELHHLPDFLFEGHASEQVGDALRCRQFWVLIGEIGGHAVRFLHRGGSSYQLVV